MVNLMGILITVGNYWSQELHQTCWGIHLVSFIGEKTTLWVSSREIANELSEIKNGSQYGLLTDLGEGLPAAYKM